MYTYETRRYWTGDQENRTRLDDWLSSFSEAKLMSIEGYAVVGTYVVVTIRYRANHA